MTCIRFACVRTAMYIAEAYAQMSPEFQEKICRI